MAPQREGILLLPRYAVALGEILGRLPHAEGVELLGKFRVHKPPTDRGVVYLGLSLKRLAALRHYKRSPAHAFDPTRDVDAPVPDHDRVRCIVDRLEARPAQTIHRGAWNLERQPCYQERHPCNVSVILTRLVCVAKVDVFYLVWVYLVSIKDVPDDESRQVIGPHRGKDATVLPYRGAQRVHDDGVLKRGHFLFGFQFF